MMGTFFFAWPSNHDFESREGNVTLTHCWPGINNIYIVIIILTLCIDFLILESVHRQAGKIGYSYKIRIKEYKYE